MTTSSIARTLEAVAHTRGLITIYHNVVNGGGVLIFEAALFRTAVFRVPQRPMAYLRRPPNRHWNAWNLDRNNIGLAADWLSNRIDS